MSKKFDKVLCVSWGIDWSKVARAAYMAEIRIECPDVAQCIDDLDHAHRISKRIQSQTGKPKQVESCDLTK